MAVRPDTEFPGRITAPDGNYPWGSSKNETTPGANDGTPYNKTRADDVLGLQQALLFQLGVTPSAVPDTAILSDYIESIRRLISRAPLFTESGAADAYVLTRLTAQQATFEYYEGMEIEFKVGNTNTGASTVNVDGLGVKDIRYANDAALTGGELVAGAFARARYNSVTGRFELPILPVATSDIKAKVTFAGATAAIAEQFNVASVVRNAVGNYTINFSNALSTTTFNAHVDVDANGSPTSPGGGLFSTCYGNKAVGSVDVFTWGNGLSIDYADVSVIVV